MTAKQNSLYWREFGAVVRYCRANGLAAPDRHALHVAALGADSSHLDFSNEDFDRVLGEFRAASRPADLVAQMRQLNQPRIRLEHAINALAPAAEYWAKIARDKFGTDDLDDLSLEQLMQLRNTLADRRRASQRRERANHVGGASSLCVDRSLRSTGPERVAAELCPADS